MNLRKSLVLLAGAAVVFAACGTSSSARTGPDGALVKRADITIEVVTHGQAIDGFWGVVRNGVKAAASDMGVTVNYSAPDAESDMVKMSQLIEAAVAKKPSGIVVSIPNPDALGPSIKKAVAAGIPVISMNSGSDVFKSLGVLAHVGQTEYEAGLGAGERFKDAGVTNAVCFNQEVGNQALTLRCNGFFDGLYGEGGADKGKVLTGNISDPAGMQATMAACAQRRYDHRRGHDPRTDRGCACARCRRGGRQDRRHPRRHVRPQRGHPHRDQGRQDGLRDRSAAVHPGLPADRDARHVRARPRT